MLVTELLEHGAKVNQMADIGGTPLHYAVQMNRADLVAILLKYGADPYAKDSNFKTPIELSAKKEVSISLKNYLDLCSYLDSIGFSEFKSFFLGKEFTLRDLSLVTEEVFFFFF